jgi:phosphate acetyltransferase
MAVVHPVDRDSLLGTVEAAQAGLITPILVGREERIRAAAAGHNLDISGLALVEAEHSHEAAEVAVRMARHGEADALMKGALHTDELMRAAVAHGTGLTTDRRMSHVFVLDVPAYPRPLLITDAALNIEPDLAAKRDIVQNAIDLALAIGIEMPKVAILSAVERLAQASARAWRRPRWRRWPTAGSSSTASSTAPRLRQCSFTGRRTCQGDRLTVAGQADIPVVPDLESGNMLVKQLDYLADSHSAGIVLGGRVPVALTSRADSALERVASCALAVLVARAAAPATRAETSGPVVPWR